MHAQTSLSNFCVVSLSFGCSISLRVVFSQEPSSDVVTSLENLDGVIEKAVVIAVDEFKKGDDDEGGGRGGGGRVSWCMPINNTHDT